MSGPRGNANQALYLAKILLTSWADEQARAQVSAATLQQAFLPGVKAHLATAYGWFLLEICDLDATDSHNPPACCAQLPAIPAGKAVPGEVRELERLEQEGWLSAMLAAEVPQVEVSRSRGNLAGTATAGADHDQAASWGAQLESLFSRMRDSLDEY